MISFYIMWISIFSNSKHKYAFCFSIIYKTIQYSFVITPPLF